LRRDRGPRQPGGGKQTAGPRHRARPALRHSEARPQGAAKPADAGSSYQDPKSHKAEFRRGGRAHTGLGRHAHSHVAKSDKPVSVRAATVHPSKAAELVIGPATSGRTRWRPPQDDGERKLAPVTLPTAVQNVAVTADEGGMRVDRFLEARFPGLSFSHTQRVIRKGEVRVNGKRTQPKNRLEAGQTVRIPPLRLDQSKPRTPGSEADEQTRAFLRSITLHEDADVLVLNKPMGLAVQGGSGTTRHLDGMLEVLRDSHGQRPRLVHRLDKDTAGCLLVAKTRFAAAALAKTFRSRSARKVYWALVAGVPKVQQGRISTYLLKEEREDESLMRIAKHGEKGASHAVTYYAVVETSGPLLSWLSLKPVTGRTHQLRAHMAHVGHPIVGDPKYFSIENWQLPGGMQNKLHLLARRIVVPHPRGGVIDATAPLPPHMQQSWNLLGLETTRYDPIVDAPEE
jgi:23S rRNA pseudouridine955/2504/2580 synthase